MACLFLFFKWVWLLGGNDEFVTFSVYVQDFNIFVALQMLAKFGDIYIHASGIEVIVVNPNGLQGKVALQHLVGVLVKQGKQLTFLGGKFGFLVATT